MTQRQARWIAGGGALWFVFEAWLFVHLSGSWYPGVYFAADIERRLQQIAGGEIGGALSGSTYYPPGYYLYLLGMSLLFGGSYEHLVVYGAILMALGLVTTYWLAERHASPGAGLLAMAVAMGMPGVVLFSKRPTFEGALFFITPLTLACAWRARGFVRLRASLALGAVVGLGMMVKWTYGVLAVGPLILAAWPGVIAVKRPVDATLPVRVRNGLLAVLVAAGVFCPWYVLVLDWGSIVATSTNEPTLAEPGLLAGLGHYVWELRELLLGAPLLVLVTLGVTLYLVSWGRAAIVATLASVGLPLAVMASLPHLEARYLVPLLPALAAGCAVGLSAIPHAGHRTRLGWTLGVVCILLGLHMTWSGASRPPPRMLELGSPDGPLVWQRLRPEPFVQALHKALRQLEPPLERPLAVAVHPLARGGIVQEPVVRYLLLRHSASLPECSLIGYEWTDIRLYLRDLEECRIDLLIVAPDYPEKTPPDVDYLVPTALSYYPPGSPVDPRDDPIPGVLNTDPGLQRHTRGNFETLLLEGGARFMVPRSAPPPNGDTGRRERDR